MRGHLLPRNPTSRPLGQVHLSRSLSLNTHRLSIPSMGKSVCTLCSFSAIAQFDKSKPLGESGRDQGHTQLELGHLSESCQIARSQGDGGACFATSSNLLAKGFEYTAVVLRVCFYLKLKRIGHLPNTFILLLQNGTVVWNPDAFATCNVHM
jgi:hypothetical protein